MLLQLTAAGSDASPPSEVGGILEKNPQSLMGKASRVRGLIVGRGHRRRSIWHILPVYQPVINHNKLTYM